MTTRHLVDPELAPLLDLFPAAPLTAETLPRLRASLAAMLAAAPAVAAPNLTVSERHIPGPADAPEVRVLCFQPTAAPAPLPALLWIHGGGYVTGSADADSPGRRALAAELGIVVVSVDYRLAPETLFPGPLEDCYAALIWLHGHADALGVDPARIAVGGASAGGGLAAALALLARDRGAVPVAFQLLLAPMLDDRTAAAEPPHPVTGEFMWTPAANRFGWAALLGEDPGGPAVSPYAAAARADQLAGLPAAFLAVGALDLFVDESLIYAQRLIRAGVPTELHVYPGAYHGFQAVPTAQVTQAALQDQLRALRRALLGAG